MVEVCDSNACYGLYTSAASNLLIHSGNIIDRRRLRRVVPQKPLAEVQECFDDTLDTWFQSVENRSQMELGKQVICEKTELSNCSVEDIRRGPVVVTLKVFASSPRHISAAVGNCAAKLGLDVVDNVLLSAGVETSWCRLVECWRELERLASAGRVTRLGVCDMPLDRLEELCAIAAIRPAFNQLPISMVCRIAPSLLHFAKANEIELLSHNDEPDLLNEEHWQRLFAKLSVASPGGGASTTSDDQAVASCVDGGGDLLAGIGRWRMSWISRYSVVAAGRGVILRKGYFGSLDCPKSSADVLEADK